MWQFLEVAASAYCSHLTTAGSNGWLGVNTILNSNFVSSIGCLSLHGMLDVLSLICFQWHAISSEEVLLDRAKG